MSQNTSWYKGKYPPTLIEAAATHDLLGMLGYSLTNDVFLMLSPEDVIVCLQAEGLEAFLRMGSPELSLEEMSARWKDFIAAWNNGGTFSSTEKDALFLSSMANQHRVEIVISLVEQGFHPKPPSANNRKLS